MGLAELSTEHRALIRASAISDEVAAERGYRTVTKKSDLEALGFGRAQASVPALLIPIRDVTGAIATFSLRPDDPRTVRGKALKYESPAGSRMVLDVPDRVRPHLGDPSVPLWVTEGSRKVDAALSAGLPCIGVIGVWNWRGTNQYGGTTALADWESIALNGREVYVVFDSDVMVKREVHQALTRLKAFLERRDARVRLVYLPAGPVGAKVGLDDFLAAGGTAARLLELAETELRGLEESGPPGHTYEATDEGIIWHKPGSSQRLPVTNFDARILTEIVEDDDVEQRQLFEIEARWRGRTVTVVLSAAEFGAMTWPLEYLGAEAIVEAGVMMRERARTAIQHLSAGIERRVRYGHTGWRQIDGAWVFLHGGGGIGEDGLLPEVEVSLPPDLEPYELPAPVADGDLVDAVRVSLELLDLGPIELMAPLLSAVYRAAIASCDFGLFLAGATGVFKTMLAALAQQHFGAGFSGTRLPASWSSTANQLEGLLSITKDVLVVIDDFAPGGTATDISKAHRDADRVFRAAGNQSGRGRMRADATLRPTRVPRGLPLGTGEDVPRGQSLRARLLILDIDAGAIDPSALRVAQENGREGRYALAMAGFVRYLAPRYDEIAGGLQAEVEQLRADLSGSHRRTPHVLAHLLVGARHLADYAREVGAVDDREARALAGRLEEGLLQAGTLQTRFHGASDPVALYLELLASAISAGRAHLVGVEHYMPKDKEAWGWVEERQEWRPRGEQVGWTDGKRLYLEPNASFAVAQALAGRAGERIPISASTLRKRMWEKGILLERDEGRQTFTVRKQFRKERPSVLVLALAQLQPTGLGGQVGQATETHQSSAKQRPTSGRSRKGAS